MRRTTISLPDSIDALIRRKQHRGESFSAAVARLIEEGERKAARGEIPEWMTLSDDDDTGPSDLSINAEKYLRELFTQE